MKFFNGREYNLSDYSNAYRRGFLQQEAFLLHDAGIRARNGLGFLFDNIPFREQPCFSSFNNFNEFTTDLQALIAKPLICLWLAKVHALRIGLELNLLCMSTCGLVFLVNPDHHIPEMMASIVAAVCYGLRANILLITETLHLALRLVITAGAVTNNVIHASGILSAVPLEMDYQNVI